MSERSGFFQAEWDPDLVDPRTGEQTGWWDLNYLYSDFLNYFKLFVGNGVFGSPTNQLRVIPGEGLTVIVKAGWAYINGAWYHNDSDKEIIIPTNSGSQARVDSIRLRYSEANREIIAIHVLGDVTPVRSSMTYDLILATINVQYGATSISASDITDKRVDENVCGLVKGLLEVETTEDLFAQYQSIFNQWFDGIKDQLTGDLAVRLQLEFDQLNNKVDTYQDTVEQDIADYKSDIQTDISNYESAVQTSINQYHTSTQAQIDEATGLVEDYVDNDYVIQEREFIFVNKVCTISDSKVKASSLLDVYFTAATITHAEDCKISVDSSAGLITLTAEVQPTQTIRGMIRVRVN